LELKSGAGECYARVNEAGEMNNLVDDSGYREVPIKWKP